MQHGIQHVDDDHRSAHETLLDEAIRLRALRERVQWVYGPSPATRGMAPVGVHQRACWADADARRPVAVPSAPTTRRPLPAVRATRTPSADVAVGLAMTGREIDLATTRVWDRLRAALRLRIGEGVMPG